MPFRFRLGLLAIAGVTLVGGCRNPEPQADSTSNASEQATIGENAQAETSAANEPVPEALLGRWEPRSYLTPDGETVDLTELPSEQQQDLAWELTAEGTIRIGNLEGTYTVEGDTIYATNPDSGDVTEFEFSLAEDRLSVEKKGETEGGVLQLVRETPDAEPESDPDATPDES